MNPFTRFLRAQESGSEPIDFSAFVDRWDMLEALVIQVYRSGRAGLDVEAVYQALRAELAGDYSRWAAALAPYWQAALAGGAPPASDPFARLLAAEAAAIFVGNRAALKALPPAREAINRYLLTLRAL